MNFISLKRSAASDTIEKMQFSANEKYIYLVSEDVIIFKYNVSTGEKVAEFDITNGEYKTNFAGCKMFHHRFEEILSVEMKQNTVIVLATKNGNRYVVILQLNEPLLVEKKTIAIDSSFVAQTLSSDGTVLVVGSRDVADVFYLAKGYNSSLTIQNTLLYGVKLVVSHDKKYLAVVNDCIIIYEIDNGKPIYKIEVFYFGMEFCFSPVDSNVISYINRDSEIVYGDFTKNSLKKYNLGSEINSHRCVFAQNGKFIACVGNVQKAVVYFINVSDGTATYWEEAWFCSFEAIEFSKNGLRLAARTFLNTVTIIDFLHLQKFVTVALPLLRANVAPYLCLDIVNMLLAHASRMPFEFVSSLCHFSKITTIEQLRGCLLLQLGQSQCK